MAYSIYWELKHQVLPVLDSEIGEKLPAIKSFYDDYHRHGYESEDTLFGFMKPRGDRNKESQLFGELEALKQRGLLVSVSVDNFSNELPLCEKLVVYGFGSLVEFIDRGNY